MRAHEKKEDDQWCVPHNIFLAVYSPSSVNVLCFDPSHGADQARGYAGKYCSKPERYFFLEGEKNGVKAWSMFCFCPNVQQPSPPSYEMKQVHNEAIQAQSPDCGTLRCVQQALELPVRPQYEARHVPPLRVRSRHGLLVSTV